MMMRRMVAAGLCAGLVAVLAPTVQAAPSGRMGSGGMMGPIGAMGASGRMGSSGPTGPSGPSGPTGSMGMPIGRGALDWVCVRDCGDYTLTCRRTVQESERLCAVASCKDEAQTARDVCSTAPRTTECAQARLALRQCMLTCLETAAGDNASCRSEELACLRTCPASANLASKDSACVDSCAGTYTDCLTAADEGAAECDAACPTDATQYECRAQCDDTLQVERRACMRAAQSCVADCPDVTTGNGQ